MKSLERLASRSLRIKLRRKDGTAMSLLEAKQMDSLDTVFNRNNPAYRHDKPEFRPFFSFGWWNTLRAESRAWKNFIGRSSIKAHDSSFHKTFHGQKVFQLLRHLNSGIIVGDLPAVAPYVTSHLLSHLKVIENKRPLIHDSEFTNRVVSGRITKLVEVPKMIYSEYIACEGMRDIGFGQANFRLITEQVKVRENDLLILKMGGLGKYYKTRDSTQKSHPGEWQKVLDSYGRYYYAHSATKKTTWKEPYSYGQTSTHYDPSTGTLGTGRILEDYGESMLVENVVCIQRSFANPEGSWKIVEF